MSHVFSNETWAWVLQQRIELPVCGIEYRDVRTYMLPHPAIEEAYRRNHHWWYRDRVWRVVVRRTTEEVLRDYGA